MFIDLPFSPSFMARRRRGRRLYKQVKTFTKDLGSAGGQILLGSFNPIDAAVSFGYLNNVICSSIQNQGEQETGGLMFYLTTDSSWNDDEVITARARPLGGGTVNLVAKRKVSAEVFDNMPGGKLYLWMEFTDITAITDVEARVVLEIWGNFLSFVVV